MNNLKSLAEVPLMGLAGYVDLYALDQIVEKMIENPKWGLHEWFLGSTCFQYFSFHDIL